MQIENVHICQRLAVATQSLGVVMEEEHYLPTVAAVTGDSQENVAIEVTLLLN